jgi:hypothetical protein
MKRQYVKFFFLLSLWTLPINIHAYNIPPIGLGSSNILDGGPIRPNPGFYLFEHLSYYYSNKFLDHQGKPLGAVSSPIFVSWAMVTKAAYQSATKTLLRGKWGVSASLPLVLTANISPNRLGISSSGSGFSNLFLGAYLQWDTITLGDRPFFVHRFEFDAVFPIGKNKQPVHNINPSSNFIYLDPYWAATLYFTKDWAVSWRINYLWCTQDKVNKIRTGDAIHFNYSMEYQIYPKLFVAINGYFLQQLQYNKLCNVDIPNSKTRIFSVGPGALYFFPEEFTFVAYFYVERKVLNSSQGVRAIMRLIKHF